jgi:hypothetical protein
MEVSPAVGEYAAWLRGVLGFDPHLCVLLEGSGYQGQK